MTQIVLTTGKHLTASEVGTLRLMFEGHTAKSAASLLSLSERTVQFHLYSVYRKLGTHSVLQTMCRLREMGVLGHVMGE